jgi:hypothetical protein
MKIYDLYTRMNRETLFIQKYDCYQREGRENFCSVFFTYDSQVKILRNLIME